jgi:hypothetical protein
MEFPKLLWVISTARKGYSLSRKIQEGLQPGGPRTGIITTVMTFLGWDIVLTDDGSW